MRHYLKKGELITQRSDKFYDITDEIKTFVVESEIREGHILIQPLHTTLGVYLNENEKFLLDDFITYLSMQVPREGNYGHDNIEKRMDCPKDEPKNGSSHLKSAFYSNPSLSLVLSNGELCIGQWQRIFIAEFDGPCPRKHKGKRQYLTSIIGE